MARVNVHRKFRENSDTTTLWLQVTRFQDMQVDRQTKQRRLLQYFRFTFFPSAK